MLGTLTKDPNDSLDYQINWARWLSDGETVAASAWTVPSGLTLVASSFTTTTTIARISGGTVSQTYNVQNRITTSSGQIKDESVNLRIRES